MPCDWSIHQWPLHNKHDDWFSKSFNKCLYPRELKLKLGHSGKHATFLDQDIKIEDGIFVYI